jgi:hypothetical protein
VTSPLRLGFIIGLMFGSLRLFINLDYVKGAPLKLGVACAIGAVMGSIGGLIGVLLHRRTISPETVLM